MTGPEPVFIHYRVRPRVESMDAVEDEFSPTGPDWHPDVEPFPKRERFPHFGNGQMVGVVDFGRVHSVPHWH